jgi:hypothetical protein
MSEVKIQGRQTSPPAIDLPNTTPSQLDSCPYPGSSILPSILINLIGWSGPSLFRIGSGGLELSRNRTVRRLRRSLTPSAHPRWPLRGVLSPNQLPPKCFLKNPKIGPRKL